MALCLAAAASKAQTYTILHEFGTNESGIWPQGALVQAADGTLYGTTQAGGPANQGQVFKIRPDGSGYAALKEFTGSDGASPVAALCLAADTLYGTTRYGGVSNKGTVFRLNTDGSGYAVLKEFTGSDGASPVAALCLAADTLYGTTISGGVSNKGTVFRLNADGSGFAVLKEFTGSDGVFPMAALCLAGDTLYGTTKWGGSGGGMFRLKTDGTGYTMLRSIGHVDGGNPACLVLSGTTLFGTAEGGHTFGRGIVFKLNTDGSDFTVLKEFTGSDGSIPIPDLVLSGDTLYGITISGGTLDYGVMFALNTNDNAYTVIRNFTAEELGAIMPEDGRVGLLVSGTTLYATSPYAGVAGLGTLFQLNTDGSGYALLKQFTAGDGKEPYSGLTQGADGVLYGTTRWGGTSNCGTVFRLASDGSDYTILREFSGSDGRCPEAGLAVEGSTLYGTTVSGGGAGNGTLFKINTDGSGYSLLRACSSYDDGVLPVTVPVLSGTTLYGGINYGKLFRVNTDGTGYSVYSIGTSGSYPRSVLLDGSTLYGTMGAGPTHDQTVYRINTDGSGFAVLKVMGGDSGSSPNGPLVLDGGTLYGTAYGGGKYLCGTVFKVNTDGSGFSVLKHFTGGDDGGYPEAGMVLCGDTLYGTAARGGSVNYGIVFRIKTTGLDFSVLKNFSGRDGRYPYGNLVLAGTNLCGTTMYGGPLDEGLAFKLSVPAILPVIYTPPSSQTAEAGSAVSLSVRAGGALPLTYLWFLNGTTGVGVSTNPVLRLLDIQPPLTGAYSVVVSNTFGAITSSPAMLQVIPPVERRSVPGVKLMGEAASLLNVDYADALSATPSWLPLDTVSLGSTPQYYFDLTVPLPSQRYYRAGYLAKPLVPPLMDLHMVPAITLTGATGSKVQVDGINRYGPTNAWFTLDTVVLSNTSQLYFDTSAWRQPERLYRLVPIP